MMPETITKPLAPQPLQVHILHRQRPDQYFTGQGWSDRLSDASAYSSFGYAVRTCYRLKLIDVELLITDGTHEFRLQIAD